MQLLRDKFTDVKLIVTDGESTKTFETHKILLASYSEYFLVVLSKDKSDIIELNETNPYIFEILLDYIYTSKLDVSSLEGWRSKISLSLMISKYLFNISYILEKEYIPDDDFYEYFQIINKLNPRNKFDLIACNIGPDTDLSFIDNTYLQKLLLNSNFHPELKIGSIEQWKSNQDDKIRGPYGINGKTDLLKYNIIKRCYDQDLISDTDIYSLHSEIPKPPYFWKAINYNNLPPDIRKTVPIDIIKEYCKNIIIESSHFGSYKVKDIKYDNYIILEDKFGVSSGFRLIYDTSINLFIGDIIVPDIKNGYITNFKKLL